MRMGSATFPRIRIRSGASSYILLPVLTTTQRDALSATAGYLIYNSTTGQVEEYTGSTWRSVGQAILTTHTADIDAHQVSPQQQASLAGGYYYAWPTENTGTHTLTASRLYGLLTYIPRKRTFDRIAIEVTTQGASGKVARLGIYNDSGSLTPGSLVLDASTVAVDSTGVKAIIISQQLNPGYYWLALVSDGTPVIRAMTPAGLPLGISSGQFNLFNSYYYVAFTYAALPDPFTASPALGGGGVGVIGLRPLSDD